jgi:hypothetical protein
LSEKEFVLPLIGTSRTVHSFLRNRPEEWFTIAEIAELTGLKEDSVRTVLSVVMLDPRIIRGKRQSNGRSLDEYAFLPFLPLFRRRPKGEKGE